MAVQPALRQVVPVPAMVADKFPLCGGHTFRSHVRIPASGNKTKTVNQNGCGKHTGQAPKRNIKSNHNMSRDSQNPILSAVKVASVHQPSPTPQSGRGHSIFDVVDAADNKVFIRIHYVGRGHPQAPRSCLFSPRSQAVNRGPHAVMMISLYPMSSALQGPQAQSIVDRFWNIEQPIACLPQETSNSFR